MYIRSLLKPRRKVLVATVLFFGMVSIAAFRNTRPPDQPTSLFSTPVSSPAASSTAVFSPTSFATAPAIAAMQAVLTPTHTLTVVQAALITAATSTLVVETRTLAPVPPISTQTATALPSPMPTQLPTESPTPTATIPTSTPTAEPTATLPEPTATPSPTSSVTSTPTSLPPTSTPIPPRSTGGETGDLPYDPNGPDRDCGDFATHNQAQRFFGAAGGPANDPHRLDGDHDGIACETLP